MEGYYNPWPPLEPVVVPREIPARTVPSYIGEGVGNWLFHLGAGDVARDYSGEGNHGEINGAKWTDEHSASWALGFDGEDDYVDCGSGFSQSLSEFTIEAWVYPTALDPRTVGRHVFERGDWNAGEIGLIWGHRNKYWRVQANELSTYVLDSNTAVSTGEWTHVVGVYDGSELRIYLNGSLDSSASSSGTVSSDTEISCIGSRLGSSNFAEGFIGNVLVYTRALGADVIQTHYDKTKVLYIG